MNQSIVAAAIVRVHIISHNFVGGIDEQLAEHFAHLFIRDPVSLFQEKVGSYDDTDTDHFENIQSTNWQTMRCVCYFDFVDL